MIHLWNWEQVNVKVIEPLGLSLGGPHMRDGSCLGFSGHSTVPVLFWTVYSNCSIFINQASNIVKSVMINNAEC